MYGPSFIKHDVCVCEVFETVSSIEPFCSVQEALLESERVNMERRNSDAVRTKLKTTPEVFS